MHPQNVILKLYPTHNLIKFHKKKHNISNFYGWWIFEITLSTHDVIPQCMAMTTFKIKTLLIMLINFNVNELSFVLNDFYFLKSSDTLLSKLESRVKSLPNKTQSHKHCSECTFISLFAALLWYFVCGCKTFHNIEMLCIYRTFNKMPTCDCIVDETEKLECYKLIN